MPDDQDGRAAYEKAKQELMNALVKKRQTDRQLAQLEFQIHNLEGAYLNDTSGHGGNIIVGFENYLKSAGPSKKRYEVTENDRMFSNSSSTYTKSLDLLNESDSDSEMRANGSTSNGLVTVNLTPASRSQELSAGQLKRERDREYQRKKRANNKRGTSVASTDETEIIPKRTTKRQRMLDEGINAE